MFNGIIYNQGKILKIDKTKIGIRIFIKSNIYIKKDSVGMSICCDGICLTLLSFKKNILEFYLSKETVKRSRFRKYKINDNVNLELPMKFGQDISGHFCQGHVDCTAILHRKKKISKSIVLNFKLDKKFVKFLIEKASILINGVSLTISKVTTTGFEIWVIPHTLKLTNLSLLKKGDLVNIEIDVLSKYIKKFLNEKK